MQMFPKPKRFTNEEVLEKRRTEPCWVCGKSPADASHIKTRGSGGPDELWNVVAKCRKHHTEWGMGAIKFLEKYPHFAFKMRMMGWSWFRNKLHHEKLNHPSSVC